ncbi:MAG TPA: response regulator [Terriglobales bacterium]|nr:response regulator [Terriglobales bacterium]
MARILIVEDNRDHLELMAYILRSHGHTIMSAGSAESGWTMTECCQQIDLVICDVHLPRVSGLSLVRRLRLAERYKTVPIMAVTAGSLGQAHEAFAAGVSRYMLKPIEPALFICEVNSCLGGANPPLAQVPSSSSALGPQQRATVLAVDDKPANLQLVAALLDPMGCRVVQAGGVEEGLAQAREKHPDLIITDVHMGDGSGFDLLRRLQSDLNLSQIPWLVTSATYLAMDERAKQFNLNQSNFILQPWEAGEFVAKICSRLPAAKPRGAKSASGD